MKLLKIGTLGIPEERWMDINDKFERTIVICNKGERKIDPEHFQYMEYEFNGLSWLIKRAATYTNKYKVLDWFTELLIILLRICTHKQIENIKKETFDYVHSSYNDFDNSALLTLLINPRQYTRAQKETRPGYSYFEKQAFRKASRVVLNDECNVHFFEKKYGNIFKGKEVLLNLDEDVRKEGLAEIIRYREKLSKRSGKIHAVILAGRVMSSPDEPRSGGRLYYIPLIEELLKNDFVVHLHTGRIETDKGRNPYEELSKLNSNFVIEDKLDFVNDVIGAYGRLSAYDVGILHAHIPEKNVTVFDKVNLPHRYYEYELAHVVPIDEIGKNVLIDKKAEAGYAIVYKKLSDITMQQINNIKWDTPTFREYFDALYGE